MWWQIWNKTFINLCVKYPTPVWSSVFKKNLLRFHVCKRIFVKKDLGIVIHLTTIWLEDRRAWLAYYRKRKKRRHDCSINLLGKISAKGRTHPGCSEIQGYIYFSVEKTEKIFHILELKFWISFQIRSRLSASFKQSYKFSEKDWIKWLPMKNSTGFKNAGGNFEVYIPVRDKRLKLSSWASEGIIHLISSASPFQHHQLFRDQRHD